MKLNATAKETEFNTELRYKLPGHSSALMVREKRKQIHTFIDSFKKKIGPFNC